YFIIYRAYENQPLVRYKTIKLSDSRYFSDSDFSNGSGKYYYAVKAFDNLNAESRLSEKGEVFVK
ncbi:MAG: hypothetical protein ACK4R9_10350, partial [Ignavibacterium sp.]